jgi:hypothetical protein
MRIGRFAAGVVLVVAACSADTIETPTWAEGVDGPTVIDESGLVSAWEYVGWPDESDSFTMRPGRYTGDFGVDAFGPDSTELVVTWIALPCQDSPIALVSADADDVRIDVTPGPSPECEAIGVEYGLRLALVEALGARTVTASLVDPVNQLDHRYP